MMYEEIVRDFALRTRKNLETIDRLHAEGQEVYEVTQLVNSTLGLIVFPQQKWFDRIPETSLDELKNAGWTIPCVVGSFPQVENFRQLMRYLRNAIAHCNVEFIHDGQDKLHLLRVWNIHPKTEQKTWEAELSVDALRAIAERFIQFLLNDAEQRTKGCT